MENKVYSGDECIATHSEGVTKVIFHGSPLVVEARWKGGSHEEPLFDRAPLPEQRELVARVLKIVAHDLRRKNNNG